MILRMMFKRLALLALSLCVLGAGVAQDFGDGTELLLTDLESEVIVGHGTVEEGTLRLNVSEDAGGFFLYVLFPEGEVSAHQGRMFDERLEVENDAGGFLALSDLLSDRGVSLDVARVSGELNPQAEEDDALLEPTDTE